MFLKIHFSSSTLLIGLILSGASSGLCDDTIGQNFKPTVLVTNKPMPLTSASSMDMKTKDSAWVLQPNDLISMTVYQEDDLSTKTTVDVDGMVMLPLLGNVKIGGMTLSQARSHIQGLYDKDYIVNPQVSLVVEQFALRQFSVMGEVQHPGSFDFPQNQPLNLLQAIAISGGYTRLSSPSKVSVRRIENGAPKVYRLDANEIANNSSENPFEILPNDIVTVGERTF
jgi:protein involved in polysaccharide export with SLBB domain